METGGVPARVRCEVQVDGRLAGLMSKVIAGV